MPYLDVNSTRLYYHWAGEFDPARETVVFLHDGLGATSSWRNLPEQITAAHHLNALVYDRHGYGQSSPRSDFPYQFMEGEVPVLEALLDALKLEKVHLVGHSDGGSISLLFAAQHPHRVRSMVTIAAHVFVEPETQSGIRDLVALQNSGKTPGWLLKLHGEKAEDLLRSWSDGWLSEMHAQWNIERWLPDVKTPLLVVQGDADEFGTTAQVVAITSRVDGAASWIVPGCGHTPHNQQPEAFLDQLKAFYETYGVGNHSQPPASS